ncbi:MAG: putative transcriptional regulatory protein [Acidimicrobiales bacterium]|nr:MAG: putative transcriptional regulatory protein [Acidimicrobiales bacterium]
MSGHSKWHSIKHKKGANDVRRGKLFAKLLRQVEVAARQGGGDLDANPTLRTMYQKARDASVPLENIERAIKRGTGELEGVDYQQVTYEAYAPHGIALYIEALTDNRNRTGSEIRTILNRNGGSMGEPGSVAWQFERKGIVTVPKSVEEDTLLQVVLEAGAEDVADDGDSWRVTCAPGDLPGVRSALEAAGVEIESADVTMLPTTTVLLDDPQSARDVLRVVDLLDDHDDVAGVYANFDIPDEVLQEVSGQT